MSNIDKLKHLQITLEEILLATNHFSEENSLGLGGFGKVYKGDSKKHGIIAVKRLDRNSSQGDREFKKEIDLLSEYKHENVVSLVGFCDEAGEKILVYKFESNGSLDKHLRSKDLKWIQRLRICLDAARGLKYLHDDAGDEHRILHRDVKSANILLDENWNAKISDFGLSRLGPANTQSTFLISNACGTVGYIDPDYFYTGHLTQKSDVFSFGVVLFEVLCGRLACVKDNKDGRSFYTLAQKRHQMQTLDKIIDPDLLKQINADSLLTYSTIAYQCLKIGVERPTMNKVVEQLQKALKEQPVKRHKVDRHQYASSWKYDVFLSFREEDSRKSLVDHLYSALEQHGILTYKGDVTLDRGDTIGPSLLKAIETSHILVIIFSENYADSSWCLDQLTHIMKCRDNDTGQIVFPIFYHVDPAEVRKQKWKYEEAFAKHGLLENNINKVESWRKALVDASNIAGWNPKHIAHGHEAKFIKEIVDTVLDKLPSLDSVVVDENLVGMEPRLQDLKSHLRIGSGGVRMVGIWGIGGGGKTTLAYSLYMELKISGNFDGCCFVSNIREESSRQHGLKYLQEKILSTVFDKRIQLESVDMGKHTIRHMLCRRNVLIILDAVDNLEQLDALAGHHNWFGDGSRIIITTRDELLLTTHRVDKVYPVSLLSHDEAIRLFRKRAFRADKPVQVYEKLSLRAISYANGLPLALQVLGSFLYGRDKNEWISVLDRLEYIPDNMITDKLRLSYDALHPVEKELFLDIACFFREEQINKAMEILDACGYHPAIGIKVLIQKALITISSDGEFDMHDLVQEMGHYIIRKENPSYPETHSRVWKTTEIDDMCSPMTNNRVEAIKYDGRSLRFPELVSKMKKLRFLCASNSKFRDDTKVFQAPAFLSNELRYIHLSGYLASPLPEAFQPTKLVILKLDNSLHKELWKGYKRLPCLKELNLKNAHGLVTTPDFDGLPCLEKLTLQSCRSLKKIHPSLGNHRSLVYASIHQCEKLSMLPTIVQMEKLKFFEIWYCEALLEFPEIQADMDSLEDLSLINVGIEVFPSSIGERCTNLTSLKLERCQQLKSIEGNFHAIKHLQKFEFTGFTQLEKLPKDIFDENCCLEELHLPRMRQPLVTLLSHLLRKLCLSCCSLKDGEIPSDICQLSSLQELDISENSFSRLLFSISQLTQLKFLNLTACLSLVILPELPSSIAILIADDCKSLEVVEDIREDCKWLSQVSLRKVSIVTNGERLLQSMLQGKATENHSMSLQLDGLDIPMTFKPPLRKGTTYTLQLPENWYYDYCGFLMCAAVGENYNSGQHITMKHEKGGTMGMDSESGVWKESTAGGLATWVGYVSFGSLRDTEWWDSASNTIWFSINFSYAIPYEDRCYDTGFGVRLVPKKSESGTMEKTDLPELSDDEHDYTHKFKIKEDSKSALKIVF